MHQRSRTLPLSCRKCLDLPKNAAVGRNLTRQDRKMLNKSLHSMTCSNHNEITAKAPLLLKRGQGRSWKYRKVMAVPQGKTRVPDVDPSSTSRNSSPEAAFSDYLVRFNIHAQFSKDPQLTATSGQRKSNKEESCRLNEYGPGNSWSRIAPRKHLGQFQELIIQRRQYAHVLTKKNLAKAQPDGAGD